MLSQGRWVLHVFMADSITLQHQYELTTPKYFCLGMSLFGFTFVYLFCYDVMRDSPSLISSNTLTVELGCKLSLDPIRTTTENLKQISLTFP